MYIKNQRVITAIILLGIPASFGVNVMITYQYRLCMVWDQDYSELYRVCL
jgi:hypothetical protein